MGYYKHYKLLICDGKSNRAKTIEIHTTEDKPQEEIVREVANKYPDKDIKLFIREDDGKEIYVGVYKSGDSI